MEHHLKTPITEKEIRRLHVGDIVYISGTIITARDEAHLKALELYKRGENLPVDFKGKGVFHCGPIMKKNGEQWETVAAGPTTSARMEMFQDKFIEAFHPAIIIGKGGMGVRTAKACKEFGCVYGAFTGGAALLATKGIKKVEGVHWLKELGMPECLWVYHVEDFGPMIVTIDPHERNLTAEVAQKIEVNKQKIIKEIEEG